MDVCREQSFTGGMGPKLMTEEEWKEHHERMRTLTGEERERYRRETHEKVRERAEERGMAMPAEPGPHARRGGGLGGPPPKR